MKLESTDLNITIERQARPKGRQPIWTLCIEAQEQIVFDQAWLSISLLNENAARWLSEEVVYAITHGVYSSPPGHSSFADIKTAREQMVPIEWHTLDSSGDDLSASFQELTLRIEHLDGPRRGGTWWTRLSAQGRQLWSSHDESTSGLRIKSRESARWLLDMLARNALSNEQNRRLQGVTL